MAGKINVTPQQLQSIINSVSIMRGEIIDAADKLKRETSSIQSVWNDDQFEVFKETVSNYHRQLNIMSDQLEREKERLIRYQDDARRSIEGFSN